MISDIAREALSTCVAPVLLGDGLRARALATKVFFKYGIQSVICDERPSAWRYLLRFGGFYKIIKSEEYRLICEELLRIADASAGGLLILAPCSAEAEKMLASCERELEQRFVIATADTLLDKIYPDNN